jgi:hypothetical protein
VKFYQVQTPAGPRFARTQSEAKAIDKNFQLVDLPIDQASLVERYNDLFEEGARFAQNSGIRINDQPATAADVVALAQAMDDEDGGYPQPPVRGKKAVENTSPTDWGLAPPEGSCERCVAMSQASRDIEEIMAITNIEWALYYASDKMLDRVEAAVAARRAELAEKDR